MKILEVQDLLVRFGGLTALDGVSFAVPERGATALIGPNGAGKTTCFDVISGFRHPDSGFVRFADQDITTSPPHRRLGIGRTFQRTALIPQMDVRDNVMLGFHAACDTSILRSGFRTPGARAVERRISEATDELLSRYGISQLAGRPAWTLALGFQRLVEMARAEAQGPRLVLLDEVASGLDEAEHEVIADRIALLRSSGCSLLIVEHNMRFVARIADHLVVLNYGRVIFDGRVEQGMSDPKVLSAYLGSDRTPDA